ncbi:hypothetical protein FEE95_12195 [Maribacter algarum]|uniref:Tetratricopeptide repeat protein n=1 Tax=Maribacter algarum (ex Zhang et al. 2020) TaxID=2578118 RepID=A0A5S3PTK0_9FLAO|nr:DUF6340 family protein [Maribacter algarum]TMM57243.1 hypothetical protein FEE95_12195 [Maribacter algarum]
MKHFFQVLGFCSVLVALTSCTSTKELTISTIEPSPVDFSSQIRKIGIVNSSQSSFVKSYSTRLEQLIVMEERWLAEKGTEAALTGLFDELAQDKRFDTVRILENLDGEVTDFGTRPSNATWDKIAEICQTNGVDAIFSLASHDTETQFSLKKTKIDQLDMMRDRTRVSAQEITLETLIENGWRVYDPKQRILVDEFTSNEQITASAKGISPVDALQAIDKRRETLLEQSKSAGSSYAQRMQPKKLDVQRHYYVIGTRNFELADDKIQEGAYHEAIKLWEEEIANPKAKISGRACYNLAVINEFNGNLNAAMNWANKSYDLHKEDATLDYITALERRQAQSDVLKVQLANTSFED